MRLAIFSKSLFMVHSRFVAVFRLLPAIQRQAAEPKTTNRTQTRTTALLLHAHSITSSPGRTAEIIFASPCVFSGFSPVVSHQKHMGWFSNCVGAGSATDEEQRLRGELSRLRSENRSLRERLGESSSASPREYGDAASSIIRGGDRRPSVDKERREEIEKERRLSLGEVPIILRADHVVQGATLLGVIWASALSRPSPSASCQTRLTALCCCALLYCCAHTSPLKPCQVPAKRVPCATSLLRRRAAPGRGLRSLRQGLQRRHQRAGATPGARVPWRGGFVRGGRVHHEAI